VPLPNAPNVPSQEELSVARVGTLLQTAAATGTQLARLSSQQSRHKAVITNRKFAADARQQDVQTAALQVEAEDIRVQTLKERVLGKKAENEVERLTRLEDDGFDALMKEKSPAELDEFISKYRFLSKQKQNEVESYIGRQIGSDHLTQVLAEYHEFSSDPGNDPNDFSLVEKLTEKLESANLSPGAHKAYTDYTLGQVGGIQRGIMANKAASEAAEIRRNTQGQLIEGFGSFMMGEGNDDDATALVGKLGDTAGGLAVEDTNESRHNLMMRASTAAIDNHLKAGTDPKIMLGRLNSLSKTEPKLHEGLKDAGAIQLVENEIINSESRAMKATLGEIQKRIVVAGSDRGNSPALVALRNELAAIDTKGMSPEAAAGVNARVGTMIFNANTRIKAIEIKRGEYNRIMRNLGSGDVLAPGDSATPEAMNEVAEDLLAQPGASLPIVAATFVADGYGLPPFIMGLLKDDLDLTVGGSNLTRAYRTWKAIEGVDEDFAFTLLNSQKPTGMALLRTIVNMTGKVDPDTDKVNEILSIVESGMFQRIQTARPAQAVEGQLDRAADNVRSKENRPKNVSDVQAGLDLNGAPPRHVVEFYMDSFAFRNTLFQMNDLNDNSTMEAMTADAVAKATVDLTAEFHVLRPSRGVETVVEERFFPGIAASTVIEEKVNEGVTEMQDRFDGTVDFAVPISIAGERRWWPVVSDDPGHDPSRAGIIAFVEWDTTSSAFEVVELHGNEVVFDTAVNRVLRGHTKREMNPIRRLERRTGEPNTIGQLDFHTSGGRGDQVMGVIERAWNRQSNDPFNIEIAQHARFATDFAKTQLKFSGGFGEFMVNRNDPILSGGAIR
jgi:hypothetical protein